MGRTATFGVLGVRVFVFRLLPPKGAMKLLALINGYHLFIRASLISISHLQPTVELPGTLDGGYTGPTFPLHSLPPPRASSATAALELSASSTACSAPPRPLPGISPSPKNAC